MAFTYFITVLTLLCLTFPALADEFTDFRIPKHRVFGLTTRADGSIDGNTYKSLESRTDQTRSYVTLSCYLFALTEADNYRLRVRSSAHLGEFYFQEKTRDVDDYSTPPGVHLRNRDSNWSLREDFNADLDGRLYPWTPPIGLRGALYGSAYYDQSWGKGSSTYDYPSYQLRHDEESSGFRYEYHVHGDLGLGWGKVRDVSGVFTGFIMSDRLQRDRVTAQDLSPATKQRIAEIFYREEDYGHRHEYSDKYFWQDVEKALRDDPALSGAQIDAYTMYRLAESLHTGNPYRESGWFVGPLLRGSHESYIDRSWYYNKRWEEGDSASNEVEITDYSSSTRRFYDELLAGAMLEYHRPLGVRWQCDLESTVLLPIRPDDEPGLSFRTLANLRYFISDRWSADATFEHRREDLQYRYMYIAPDDDYRINSWSAHVYGELGYSIEDHWRLIAAAHYQQAGYDDDYPDYFYNQQHVESHWSFSLGVVYHIAGIGSYYYRMPPDYYPYE